MLHRHLGLATICLAILAASASAQQYSVESLAQPAPADGLSPEISGALSETGLVVKRDGSRVVCEIWLAKSLAVKEGFTPSSSLLYPLEPGQLIGVIRYPRKAEDFRGQEIPRGVYTIRFALQPEDGNHVGTSDTRDFLLLAPAADDQQLAPPDVESLNERSATVAGGTHPTMMCLLKPSEGDTPAMVHDEARELWSVRCSTKTAAGDDAPPVVLQIVVVGKAEA